jgi:ribose transport system permease protein
MRSTLNKDRKPGQRASENTFSYLSDRIQLLGPARVPLIAPAVMIILLAIVMFLVEPRFFNPANLRAIGLDMAIVLILGVGMTVVITARGIDLSIGAILILSSVVLSAALKDFGLPITIAILLCLLTGVLCGLANGLMISKLKMPDFIVTLASELAFRGLALVYAGGAVFYGFPEFFRFIGRGRIFDIPMPIIISLVLALVAHFIFTSHRLGLRLHAVGQNPVAARRLGINPDAYKIGSYVLMGFLAAVGGIVLTGRLDAVVASGAVTILLNTIAAVIVGGTNLFGGKGSMLGTVLGAALLAMIANAVVMLGFEAFWQHVAAGIVILVTIAMYSRRSAATMA